MVSFSNGTEHDVLLAEDRAARQRDAIAAGGEQLGRDRKRIGEDVEVGVLEELDQREGRGAAIDDDAFAGRDELRGGARDRALLRHAHVLAHRERHADQVRLMPRTHRFGAAADALDLALLGERIDVAADGGLGRPEQIEQVADAHDGALIDELQNQVMAFFFQHWVTLDLGRDRL